MTDGNQLADVWRRAADANMRYYRAVGALTLGHIRAVSAAAGELWKAAAPRPAPQARTVEHAPQRAQARAQPAMVLESEAGGAAIGAFVVENALDRSISAPVVASAFVAPAGKEARPAIAFEPEVVVLEPGEQVLVRVVAAVDESLEPNVGYRGDLTVPGLSGTQIPVVLRRRPTAPATPAPKRKSRAPRPKQGA
jgi:hypothetical protein